MLKTLFASKGFSQKALEGLADILVPNLTEESTTEELTAAIQGLQPMTDIMQSEINRQVNEAKKPKVVEPEKPVEEPVKPAAPAEDMPEWAKALVTSTQALAQGLQAIQTEKIGSTRKDQYLKALDGTSDVFKAKALKDFSKMKFDTDEEFNEWLAESEEDAKGFIQEEANDNLGFDRPAGGAGKQSKTGEKEVSPAMKELIAERTAKAEAKAAQSI